MGCHTWFYKRLTAKEIERAKTKAEVIVSECILSNDLNCAKYIADSIDNCDYKWLLAGYGFDKGLVIQHHNIFYLTVCNYHDIFRVKNYPKKKLLSYKQLKKWMGRRWYELNAEQKDRLRMFWKKYPKGLIKFG